MEKQIIKPPVRWTEKIIQCRDLNKEYKIDPNSMSKEGFWEKPDHNELNKEFQRQLKNPSSKKR